MTAKIILGYAGVNTTLREPGDRRSKSEPHPVRTNRTIRAGTIRDYNRAKPGSGIEFLQELYMRNLADLYKIIQWNVDHRIRFFRINSDLAPHISNPEFLRESARGDFRSLVYDPRIGRDLLQNIGKLAREHNMRLTFHPDPFVVINSRDPGIVLRSIRDLFFHSIILEMLTPDAQSKRESVMILHVGGVYGEKVEAMNRWIRVFRSLPPEISKWIVLENDETGYNIYDVLQISGVTGVRVVFDIFHHRCYLDMLRKRALEDQTDRGQKHYQTDSGSQKHYQTNNDRKCVAQPRVYDILLLVARTWPHGAIKIHISEQKPHSATGSHSDYVRRLPPDLFRFAKYLRQASRNNTRLSSDYNYEFYVMVEAKAKEEAVLRLRKKYGSRVT